MNSAEAYIPTDRRAALAQQRALPTADWGAVLFVDIAGFTPLTGALQRAYGARRGAEELTRQLNRVYTALINAIERYAGSVIGFSGDGITCWFGSEAFTPDPTTSTAGSQAAIQAAVSAALAVQAAMATVQTISLADGTTLHLTVRTSLAAGPVRRFTVGDPAIQLIDVLAGATLDRVAAADQIARQAGVVVDATTVATAADTLISDRQSLGAVTTLGREAFALVTGLRTPFPPQAPPPTTPLPETLVRSWVLPTVYERIQSQQERFLAELRPAAALFLKFTGIDYDHDAEAPAKLDHYVRWVQRIVNQYEGALIQLTTGDKGSYLYAAFGAPIAHDDDMVRAAAVGHALRQPPADCAFITAVQIGISYGTMRVGAYGSESRRTYGVLGSETIIAARLMTIAEPGQVVITQTVAEAIGEQYEVRPLGAFKLKGRAEPQPLFALEGPKLQPGTVAQRSQKLFATPLVGREAELRVLTTAAAAIQVGQGQVIRIVGGAGLGKSHLVATFAQLAHAQGFQIAVGSGQSTAQGAAYLAVRPLLQGLLGVNHFAEGSVEEQIAGLTQRLTAINPSWSLRLPLLGDLLGLPIPENATTAAFDARLRQEALLTLSMEIIHYYAQQQPLLLIIEDVHWLDEASQGIVLALAGRSVAMGALLLLVHRPPVRESEPFLTELAALLGQTVLPLPELTTTGVIALVQQRLQGTLSPLAASLIQIQAQGNPFFTEELVDALQESTQLQEQGGSWTLATELTERLRNAGCLQGRPGEEVVNPAAPLAGVDLGIPDTIQGIILSRLDRLSEAVKLTVKVASVIGRVFSHALLLQAHPAQRDQWVLDQELETLLVREFARQEESTPRRAYLFKHNITQEVVYQTLLSDQRTELHLRVATALERLEPEQIEALALHYYNSNVELPPIRQKALHYLEAAGQRAKRDYANETALSYFDRALGLAQQATWLQAKVDILHILGRRDEEATTLAQLAATPDVDPGQVSLLQGSYFEAVSDYAQAQQWVEQALVYSQSKAKRDDEVECLRQLGVILARQAEYDTAQTYYQRALALTEAHSQLLNERAALLYGLSVVKRQQGNYPAAKAQLEAALALYQQSDHRQGEARILTALGHIAHFQRDYGFAQRFYQDALAIQQVIGDRTGEGSTLMSLGQVGTALGNFSQAEALLSQALHIFQTTRNRWWEKIGQNGLGITAFSTGRYEKARAHFQDALIISQEIGDGAGEAIALLNTGQVLREQKQLVEAQRALQQSLTMAEEQGDKDLAAQCWSDLAICALALEDAQQAISGASQAYTLFEELGVRSALPTELGTLAQAELALHHLDQAATYSQQTFALLEELGGQGPDYPHRDYFTCYTVFHALTDHELAERALQRAYAILQQKAQKISDATMRHSFLHHVAFNRHILAAAAQQGIAAGAVT